jgi:predicted Zn-dependent protease
VLATMELALVNDLAEIGAVLQHLVGHRQLVESGQPDSVHW